MTRGFGFVTFEKSEDAKKAVDKLHDSEFDGKWIIVEISKRDAPRPKTPGRYLGVTRAPPRDRRYGGYRERRPERRDRDYDRRDRYPDRRERYPDRYERRRYDDYDRYDRRREEPRRERPRRYSRSD